jgi:predicted transcriptional regulator
MNKKRNRLEIIRDILLVIRSRNGKIKPTHILYKSNLSHQMMEEYLKELIDKKFIIEQKLSNSKTYVITDKGINYLNKYALISDFTESFGLNE